MKELGYELVKATEAAAIAASKWVGSGDKLSTDKAATEAMQDRLSRITNFCGNIRIGEGKKDGSYGLFKGDSVCGPWHDKSLKEYDIAVDPVDGTRPTVESGPEAMSVIAVSEKGTMYASDEYYMLKLAISGAVAKHHGYSFSLSEPLPQLCAKVASALDKPINRLMVCILNRPRHQEYIEQMRTLGVRIKLIHDCDISGSISTCQPDGEIDMQFGVGGAPEAVITAAAMKCLGGFLIGQIWKDGKVEGPELGMEDLVRGECVFAATGITNGSMLKGVRFDSRGPITNSVFMRSESGTIRWVTTNHGN